MNEPQKITETRIPRIQLVPNLMQSEKRICLTRIRWETPNPKVEGYQISNKLSVSLQWKLEDFWIGAFWQGDKDDFKLWICLLPCLPIRIHMMKSYGGIFP